MKAENIKFLEENKRHWITLRDAQYMNGLNSHEREGMQRVMSEEFQPGYSTDLWCPPCVSEMVTKLYTNYERWQEENKKKDEIKVTASFPSHKNHRRKK